MARLLYIKSSPRDASTSSAVAKEFLTVYRDLNPNDEVVELDLWKMELPRFDGVTLDAKYKYLKGANPTGTEIEAWKSVLRVVDQFKSADRYLFSVPMWNFSIPYVLKHYFDVLVQPGFTFSFSPESGYTGLVTDRKVTVVYASGGTYDAPEMRPVDFQTRYVETMLDFIGFKDIQTVIAAPTLADEISAESANKAALQRARELAGTFS